MEVHSRADIDLQHLEASTPEHVNALEDSSDLMESPRWSRLLAGPVDPGERGGHAGEEPTFLVFNMVNFLYTVFSFSRMRAENSRGADETPDPGADPVMENPEWCGEWEDIGQILKEFSDPVVWDFPCDQIQNPAEVGKHLKEKCHDDSKEKKIIAVSWALAYAHCTLLDTVGQQREAGGRGDKSAATPVTQAAANTPATQVIAKPDSEPKPAAKPDSEPKPLAVAVGRKHTSKTDRPVDDDDPGEGPSKQGIWDPCHMIQLSIKEYWGGANPHSRWTRLLGSVAQRYLCSDDLYMQQDQWKTIEQGIQCLREMTVAEIIFSDDLTTKNADLVPCTSVMWHKLIKQEIAHAVALGPVRTEPEVKNVLYFAARNHGLSWSLWQKVPSETRDQPLGFWSRSYRGSEANYTPTEKEILAADEGVQAASEVIGMEAQLLLAPRLPVLVWMFKAKGPSSHHATNATQSKWIAIIMQRAHIDEEEQEQVTRAEEAPMYNQLPGDETHYTLLIDGYCRIVGMNWKWKAAVLSPTWQVAEATEGEGGSSQLVELKAVQLALDIAKRGKWPKLYLYIESWIVANALWGWLERWKEANWKHR
ncbi:hypothetical protein TURU_083965 [Turdus rufiventris]|nr:hypothetical protein TURU_083965 [Turdus rufiventris]